MQITFFSNFLVPHQVAFCQEMAVQPEVAFTFVATQPFDGSSVTAGFSDLNMQYDFCLPAYRSESEQARAEALCRESDVVLMGAAPESWLRLRMRTGRLTFRVSERLFKPLYHAKSDLMARLCTFKGNTLYAAKPLYLLAAGAYAAADYAACGAFRGKAYRWGYFPAGSQKTEAALLAQKAQNPVPLVVWAGRMINWKHAEAALDAADYCLQKGLRFRLEMLGSGPEESALRAEVEARGLSGCVHFGGARPNAETIAAMEQADVFLATSDENEGWGAVVNEAMSAGCAVIASRQMGSVPWLIVDGKNGMSLPSAGEGAFGVPLARLLQDAALRRALGRAARHTIDTEWNAATAAKNLVVLCSGLQQIPPERYPATTGPCSSAEEKG